MKIQKSASILASVMLLGLFSCSSNNRTDYSSIESTSAETAKQNVVTTPSPTQTSSAVNQQGGTVFYPPIKTGQFLSASTTGINPAHGQPGHDCAVAVGAPLRAAVPTAPVAVANTPLQPQTISAPAPNLKTNLKVNPAHGQPGHDCAVAVGAPLGGSVSVPTSNTVGSSTLQTEAQPVAVPTPNFGANLKVNPAHGKPGHDCAVAVGAPLPAK